MSSHYIYVVCSEPDCEAIGSIYTGDSYPNDFDNPSWEGEFVTGLCNEHYED